MSLIRIFSQNKVLFRTCLVLSVLWHLFLMVGFSTSWQFSPKSQKNPDDYVPSYFYHEDASAPKPQQQAMAWEKKQIAANGLEKPLPKQNPNQQTSTPANASEPVHLLGDKKADKPLLIILGKAITARLVLPKVAVDFGLRGTAYVSFVIHPDGQITDVQLVKSSGTQVLDEAAVAGISAISPVTKIIPYVKEIMPVTLGIIFG